MKNYTLTYNVPYDAQQLTCLIALNPNVNEEYVYTDNWRLTIQ